jgi:hypothetical protein
MNVKKMSAANKIRIIQTVLGACVAAFALSVVVASHWWTSPPPPPPPPQSVVIPVVKEQVVGMVRDQFNTTDEFKELGLTVVADLTLINTDLNKYDGLANVHTRKAPKSSSRSPCGPIPPAR